MWGHVRDQNCRGTEVRIARSLAYVTTAIADAISMMLDVNAATQRIRDVWRNKPREITRQAPANDTGRNVDALPHKRPEPHTTRIGLPR